MRDIKQLLDGYILMNVANRVDCFRRPMLDDQATRLGRVERRMCWEEKVYE